MKILITGSAGFIGFHVTKKLLERGDLVVGLDNINNYYEVSLKYDRLAETGIFKDKIAYGKKVQSTKHTNYKFIKLNLEDSDGIKQLFDFEKFEKVIHLAGQAGVRYSIENPLAYIQSNIVGFANILECCRKFIIKHLVYASSSSVYGANTKIPFSINDNTDHPLSIYAASKKSNELMAHTYSHLFQLPTTGLRFFTVYGPWGRPDMALLKFTKAIDNGNSIQIFNDGKHKRDFTYIDDIVTGIILIIDKPAKFDPKWKSQKPTPASSNAPWKLYNIGNNDPRELNEYIIIIEKYLGKNAIKEMLPLQPGDLPITYADVSELIEEFQFQPKTSIDEGIRLFIEWYKSYTKISNQN